ncbi:MAG: iron-siderophore transport system substrate-binding protein [Thermoleophilaceae bacterium]|nr:iron-siderophore transport system substrate-binding protein [Thermoleophilaceae bacterium]
MLAVLALLAVGCQESGFDESKETSKPLKVQHALGETKVPGQAREPLTLTVDTLDDTLALKVRPARAAVPGAKLPAYLREAGQAVSLMRPVTASDLPAVEAVHPDLILGSADGQGKLYEDLSRIAPTVMTEGAGGQWKLNLRLAGEALGRTNDAEGLLIDYDREAAQTRQAISGQPQVAVVRATADGLRYAPRDSFAATILADVGVKRVGDIAKADTVLLSSAPGAAHVDGSVTHVDDELWWGSGGPIAARAALSELRDAWAG